jgi:hypothetical protein
MLPASHIAVLLTNAYADDRRAAAAKARLSRRTPRGRS